MFFELLLFSVVSSIDSFTAAIALGFRSFTPHEARFFVFISAATQGLATAVGFFLGSHVNVLFGTYGRWAPFLLLFSVGVQVIYEACIEIMDNRYAEEEIALHGLSRILFFSAITSIDAVGIGMALGIVGRPLGLYSVSIGIGTLVAASLGLALAGRFSPRSGARISLAGGAALILLGVKMLEI